MTAERAPKRKSTTVSNENISVVLPQFSQPEALNDLGPYRIMGVIGRGGMGTVYRAEVIGACELPRGTHVAIKLLRQIADGHERQRFAREAGYLQALRHRGIVRVLDVGEFNGMPYLVMQLVHGESLDALVCEGGLDEAMVVELGIQILEALHAAHLAGILHRDIKPSNIMVTGDRAVKLLDFGLAQRMDASSRITITGTVVGTPAYMSPEQANGDRAELSRRSDIYSVGACLYELLTGEQPYVADNSMAILRRIIDDPLVPPSRHRQHLSRDLETVVIKAMAKHPNDRYQAADDMAEDLRRIKRGRRIRARRPGFMKPLLRSCWSQRSAIAAVGLFVFVTFSCFAVIINHLQNAYDLDRQQYSDHMKEFEKAWTPSWECKGPLKLDGEKKLTTSEGIGPGMMVAELDRVIGPVRVAATVKPHSPKYSFDLIICDPGNGAGDKGYRVTLTSGLQGDSMSLKRDGMQIGKKELAPLVGDETVRLSIERDGNLVTCKANDQELHWTDPLPLRDPKSSGVYLAYAPQQTDAIDACVERRRSGKIASGLTEADTLRVAKDWYEAIRSYKRFLHDNPNDELVPDALLGQAFCEKEFKQYHESLETCVKIIKDYGGREQYELPAMFMAWQCANQLKQPETEEHYLHMVVAKDPAVIVSVTSQTDINTLILSYIERARLLADKDPDRAIALYHDVAEFAHRLSQWDKFSEARTGAGDVRLAKASREEDSMLARSEQLKARDEYQSAQEDTKLSDSERWKILLKVAEAERLAGLQASAMRSYNALIGRTISDKDEEGRELSQWARLWLGDYKLQLALNRNPGEREFKEARDEWRMSTESESLPGQIMARLSLPNARELDPPAMEWFWNDVEYFNARILLLGGHLTEYHNLMRSITRRYPRTDWPTTLAVDLINRVYAPGNDAIEDRNTGTLRFKGPDDNEDLGDKLDAGIEANVHQNQKPPIKLPLE
jgi:serine/threonine protein kinase/tetratricopeptide (TPR) repeat protein